MKPFRLWGSGWVFWLTWRLARKRAVGFLSIAVETKDSESVLARLTAAVELLEEDPRSTTDRRTVGVLVGETVSEHFYPDRALVVFPAEAIRQLGVDRVAEVIDKYAAEVHAQS